MSVYNPEFIFWFLWSRLQTGLRIDLRFTAHDTQNTYLHVSLRVCCAWSTKGFTRQGCMQVNRRFVTRENEKIPGPISIYIKQLTTKVIFASFFFLAINIWWFTLQIDLSFGDFEDPSNEFNLLFALLPNLYSNSYSTTSDPKYFRHKASNM
jgi:hypothetical protein